jgi:glycosyltransferase involved in cell wall biosynthesis
LLSFKLATMSFGVTVRDNRGSKNFEIAELDNLQFAFRHSKLKDVFINCAVSFPQPLMLQKFILALVRNNYSRLVVAVHEYFFICPSHFLLNNEGQFCGVPNIRQCNQCLPIHKDGFVSLTGARSISEWRDSWGTFLKRSDQILCFSTSSQILLKRAYPDLGTRILLQPHSVAPIQVIHFDKRVNNILTIGVLGAISEHKGSLIVGDLARAIEATTTLVRIVVIGTLDSSVKSSAITVTGNYEHDRLADIVEKYKVNIVLLPSICPETFSYVAHETIGMGLPLACFDLGAQAELVRGSKFGLIASSQEGPSLLKELQKFNQLINASNARATV